LKLVVFSHKVVWASANSPLGYATDGGFVYHMEALALLFEKVRVVVPADKPSGGGETPFTRPNIEVVPLKPITAKGLARKLLMPFWFLHQLPVFIKNMRWADAVHAPIPGDVGTIGMLLAHASGKPLYVRHCGNWYKPATVAEKAWKWYMQKYAGGKRVFLATGGGAQPPSPINPAMEWIFSTSLWQNRIAANAMRSKVGEHWPNLKLIIACRQDEKKGTGRVLDALHALLPEFPTLLLDVVGGGPHLAQFKEQAKRLGIDGAVTFYGSVGQAQVVEAMKQADLFCYPTDASEGFPKVVVEAMSCGLPVITTPVSVLATIIPQGNVGVLLQHNTPECLAAAIRGYLINRLLLEEQSANCMQFAQQFSLENWAEVTRKKLEAGWGVKIG
jgi:glycosyltransferase involved in cell wall biosynthesis